MKVRTGLAVLSIAGMLLAGCGGSSKSSTSGSSGPSGHAPVVVAYLAAETGQYADPQVDQAIKLAAKEINANGGLAGHPIDLRVFNVPPDSAPTAAINAMNQAIASHPVAMVGIVITDQLLAVNRQVEAAGIPLVHFSVDPSEDLGQLHNQWLFRGTARNDYLAQAGALYMTQQQHLTTLGALNTTDAASTSGVNAFIRAVPQVSHGTAKVTVHQSLDPSATDATPQILALKATQGWFSQAFPQTHAIELKERQQNGITAPVMLDFGGDTLLALKLVTPQELSNVYYTATCAPLAETSNTKAQSFLSSFEKTSGGTPPIGYLPPSYYDGLYLVKAAVSADGGSITPSAIRSGLTKLTYGGVCGTYHADANQNLLHRVTIVSLDNAQYSLKAVYSNLAGLSKS